MSHGAGKLRVLEANVAWQSAWKRIDSTKMRPIGDGLQVERHLEKAGW